MDQVLHMLTAYAAAHLDDVIIHSDSWAGHMQWMAMVLEPLRQTELTANPKKCSWYVGYQLDRGEVCHQVNKKTSIAVCLRFKMKKEMGQFLGLADYYQWFILTFSELTSPLTDLTRKGTGPMDMSVAI